MIEYDALDWPKGNEDVKTYYVHYVEGLEATAARRLELLRETVELLYVIRDHYAVNEITTGEMIERIEKELADDDD